MNDETKRQILPIAPQAYEALGPKPPPNQNQILDIEDLGATAPPAEWREAREAGILDVAKTLFVPTGKKVEVRFHLFGLPPHFLRKIVKHQVYNRRDSICPRWSDPAIGGNPQARCLLCEIESARGQRDPISPRSYLTWLTYVCVTRRWEGAEEKVRDDDKRAVPYQFWPHREVIESIVRYGKTEPTIFDREKGRGFVITHHSKSHWTAVPASTAEPLFQTPDPDEFASLCRRLEGWLVEPSVRVSTPEQIEEAAQVLRATLRAPRRATPAFRDSLSTINSQQREH
jgi:hypothetical protein